MQGGSRQNGRKCPWSAEGGRGGRDKWRGRETKVKKDRKKSRLKKRKKERNTENGE